MYLQCWSLQVEKMIFLFNQRITKRIKSRSLVITPYKFFGEIKVGFTWFHNHASKIFYYGQWDSHNCPSKDSRCNLQVPNLKTKHYKCYDFLLGLYRRYKIWAFPELENLNQTSIKLPPYSKSRCGARLSSSYNLVFQPNSLYNVTLSIE